MSVRSDPVLRGACSRSAVDHDLSDLFAEITAARAADRTARLTGRRDDASRGDSGRLAASLGAYARALETYRLTAAAIARTATRAVDLEQPTDRARYEATLQSGARLPVESCKLLDYRRQPTTCWRPGLGL